MRSMEDKGCLNSGPSHEISTSSGMNFEFHNGNVTNRTPHHRAPLGKPAPSKWDDAQKWLVNLSRGGDKKQPKNESRNSNADDKRLIAPFPKKDYYGIEDEGGNTCPNSANIIRYEVETKKVDCDESIWKINQNSTPIVRSICVRDMGTEMTPIASQEPSRTGTPIRATTPATRSPISSGSSTPVRCQNGSTTQFSQDIEKSNASNMVGSKNSDQPIKLNPMEMRALAWDEAERTKYVARYKREEVKIQAWENHEKRKAEMEMKRMEVKAERQRTRAQERYANKLVATRRIAEEKRANAEAKLNEKSLRTSERADYIRRTGHLPSSFSIKLPSLCW